MRCLVLILMFLPASAFAFPVPRAAATPSIADTTWAGDGVVGPTRYTFHANGKMTYSYNSSTYTTGTWKQDGAKIYWECNNKYCEFEGTLEGQEISGKSWNVKDFRKDLKFKKVEE